MDFTAFTTASLVIQIHIIATCMALILGPLALIRRRRDFWHKVVGYIWVASMVATAVSSLMIFEIRLIWVFSPIHFLSLDVLYSLFRSIQAIRNKDISTHRKYMWDMYAQAIGAAGLFTFLPGRLMNEMFPSNTPMLVFAIATLVFGAGLFAIHRALKPVMQNNPL
jgi:uncharacterized membrane protein